MKVYVIEENRCSGSWAEQSNETWIYGVVDTSEKARKIIEDLSQEYITKTEPNDGYPKITLNEPDCITVARNSFEDDDVNIYSYTEYEVG